MENKAILYNKINSLVDNICADINGKVKPNVIINKYYNIDNINLLESWAGLDVCKFIEKVIFIHSKQILKINILDLFSDSKNKNSKMCKINIQKMLPEDIINGSINLKITYSFSNTLLGKIVIAFTDKGICFIGFCNKDEDGLQLLKVKFPNAEYLLNSQNVNIPNFLNFENETFSEINLYLKGTDFQIEVWKKLLQINFGEVTNYENIANSLGLKNGSRAVGTAIGSNPIIVLIPCHRVVQKSSALGGFLYGLNMKIILLSLESLKSN